MANGTPSHNAITIQQNDAHAWLEYWQKNIGWQQLDPTSFIAPERIEKTIRNHQLDRQNQEDYFSISGLSWPEEAKLYWESAQFFAERWFLFYNQNTQQNFLQNIGLGQWSVGELLQVSIACMFGFFVLLAIYYHWWQRQPLDPLLVEYHLLQKQFQRLMVPTPISATLHQQCQSLMKKAPGLASMLSSFIERYEQLRLQPLQGDAKTNKNATILLFRTLRNVLRRK